jgi:hypothetical protein
MRRPDGEPGILGDVSAGIVEPVLIGAASGTYGRLGRVAKFTARFLPRCAWC